MFQNPMSIELVVQVGQEQVESHLDFCDAEEKEYLKDIEKLIGKKGSNS
jgi:hypothetical protein